MMPHYHLSYLKDAMRIYRLLPGYLQLSVWRIFAFQIITAIFESSTIIVMSFFMTSLSSPDATRNSWVVERIISFLPGYWAERLQGEKTFVTAMCLVLVLFIGAKNLLTGFTVSQTTVFSERLGLFISHQTYRRYFNMSYFWHISPESADVLMRLNYRASLAGMVSAIMMFFSYAVCSMLMFGMLFSYEPAVALILFVIFTAVSVSTYAGMRKKVDMAGQRLQEITGREVWSANMAVRGIREIIIYRKQDAFLKNITDAIRQEVPYKAFLSFSGMVPSWLLEFAGFTAIFVVMVTLAYLGRPMHEIIGSVSLFFLAAWRTLPAVSRCMGLTIQIRGSRPMALQCLELLEGFSESKPIERIEPAPDFHFVHNLELRNASFSYPGSGECLHSLALMIQKGESVAVIGPSGAGKSTLAMILAGLLEPASGDMLVDGVPLTPEGREAYRHRVGYVPQNPLLLPGSIADNVALSRWGEGYDMEKVRNVCNMAAMDFLSDTPHGLSFPIGDGGQGLSGGQAQRVSIARALFHDPEVLIFDEATSSLDMASESVIGDTIRNLKGKVTSIIIAHRLTSIEKCDRMIWMANGEIVEVGTPEEIIPKYVSSLKGNDDTSDEVL